METGNRLEPGEGWGARGAEWERIQRLLELARSAAREELSQERREQLRERLLARLERDEIRRRRARFILGGAAVVVLAMGLSMLVRHRLASSA
jgi:hypothetical protein